MKYLITTLIIALLAGANLSGQDCVPSWNDGGGTTEHHYQSESLCIGDVVPVDIFGQFDNCGRDLLYFTMIDFDGPDSQGFHKWTVMPMRISARDLVVMASDKMSIRICLAFKNPDPDAEKPFEFLETSILELEVACAEEDDPIICDSINIVDVVNEIIIYDTVAVYDTVTVIDTEFAEAILIDTCNTGRLHCDDCLAVSPSPNNGRFVVKVKLPSGATDAQVFLFDENGIAKRPPRPVEGYITSFGYDISGHPPGVYIVIVTFQIDGIFFVGTKKIVVQ